ncbi:Uncharacterized protein GBIM_17605, partial [Gryllus bimaculatus]
MCVGVSQMADQAAATFGSCCFSKGDVKVTLGTGTFLDMNTGASAHASVAGAAAGLLGVKPTTRRAHVVRAILESVAFRVRQLLRSLHDEAHVRCRTIRIDGGVSRNDFVAQLLADVAGARVERAAAETSALGAAFVAGLAT